MYSPFNGLAFYYVGKMTIAQEIFDVYMLTFVYIHIFNLNLYKNKNGRFSHLNFFDTLIIILYFVDV